MKPKSILPAAAALAATTLAAGAQTTIMDAATNNGSFETIDPHTAPITNTTRRASNSGAAFLVGCSPVLLQGGWEITGGGFHGIDTTGTGGGPKEGNETTLTNHNATTNGLSGPIPIIIAQNDTFDISFHTMGNAVGGVCDYSVSLRFDEDPATDVELLAGTHTTADPIAWEERVAPTFTYTTATNAGSVQVLFSLKNNTGGSVDQVYLDLITLTTSASPLDPAGDEDEDGLSNGDELSGDLNPYDLNGQWVGAGNGGSPTNPTNADSDGDSIEDGDEISPTAGGNFETNPNSDDTDNDGLLDGEEINGTTGFLTDPTEEDSDFDTLPDLWEIDNGLDPTDDGSIDEDNGDSGDPDGDNWINYDEFDSGTDPQDPDTDADGLNDGLEYDEATDPLDPDTDHDGLTDGAEVNGTSSPFDKDSDFDTFSDYAEINLYGTLPDDDSSVPSAEILIDTDNRNGSFEIQDPTTAPIENGFRRAISATGSFTIPDWTCTWTAGYTGFDGQVAASDGSVYGFVNDGAQAVFQSSAITMAIPAGQVFHIQMETTNNNANGNSSYNVGLSFDGGAPVEVGIIDHAEDKADEYYERNLTYQVTQAASSVALVIDSDNSNGGNDQPRFDVVRLYSEAGTLPSLLKVVDVSMSGSLLTVEFTSSPGETYTMFFGEDLVDFSTELDNAIPADAGETTTYSIDLDTVLDPVPPTGFVRIGKN